MCPQNSQIRKEDRLTPVSSLGNVMRDSACYNARDSGHGKSIEDKVKWQESSNVSPEFL